ncbi:hypothetical protein PQD69_gp101 [Carnobacterium phage cd4]|uniref:Uncharacterized protein n=1 Tax=Carnobacterium phage cd4 TaxID=2849246 RepID=A0AAE7SWQ1_9CAUD|nr:hypothetical protein PQD69_gp101 [Carnobacterium phage cd4]QXP45409.1 hypothetical protein cd4_101 [Carnobacterium phage cd4]
MIQLIHSLDTCINTCANAKLTQPYTCLLLLYKLRCAIITLGEGLEA